MAKAKYAQHVAKKGPTPQSQPIPGKTQIANNAGGFVFKVGDWEKLDRFLILGAEGGSYYVGERELVRENAKSAQACIKEDGLRVVARVVEISDSGRAPKNDPALFVLALCSAAEDVTTRQAALAALHKVARIGTHLFHFVDMMLTQRGWGRANRRAVAEWYNHMTPLDHLANLVVKYQQRDGWSNRDLLRLSHPKTTHPERKAIYDWICGRKPDGIHPLIAALENVKKNPNPDTAIAFIERIGLPREAIPTELLNDAGVWRALLKDMPITALIRNLGKMSSIGLLKPLAPEVLYTASRLTDETLMRKGRVHPMQYLLAQLTYVQGRGDKGKLTWTPVQQIVSALETGFYRSFKTVVPSGKAILLGLDISGSMDGNKIAGTPLDARGASAAMALVTMATEPNTHAMAFSSADESWSIGHRRRTGTLKPGEVPGAVEVKISPDDKLANVVRYLQGFPHGGTDCSLPMKYALAKGIRADAFVIYTDNETWAGDVHASQVLQQYRKETGINAKMVVVGMVSNSFSIADPDDPGMLDVVGFDANTPAVISDFIRG